MTDSSSEPEVRIGIVSWNTAALLDACLASLPAALGDVTAEVVVVDNASEDESASVAGRYAVKLIQNTRNVGYAAAMNQALAPPRPPVVIALNPDTVAAPGSLGALVQRLQAGAPDVGLLVPQLRNPDGTLQHSVHRFPSVPLYLAAWFLPQAVQRGPLGRALWLDGAAPHDSDADIDWAIGAVHAIRSAALEDRDPYDERWFMYVEDLDLCWRLARRGWRRQLFPAARVVHVGNAAGGQAWGSGRYRRYMEASYRWYSREKGPGRARLWALTNIVGSVWWWGSRMVVASTRGKGRQTWAIRPSREDLRTHWQVAAGSRANEQG